MSEAKKKVCVPTIYLEFRAPLINSNFFRRKILLMWVGGRGGGGGLAEEPSPPPPPPSGTGKWWMKAQGFSDSNSRGLTNNFACVSKFCVSKKML